MILDDVLDLKEIPMISLGRARSTTRVVSSHSNDAPGYPVGSWSGRDTEETQS